jgi:hypothetical protein
MNEFDVLGRLAQRARDEQAPELDVSQRVMRRIERQARASGVRGLKVLSATAGLLSLVGLAVLLYPSRDPDPLIRLSRVALSGTGPNSITRVLQP